MRNKFFPDLVYRKLMLFNVIEIGKKWLLNFYLINVRALRNFENQIMNCFVLAVRQFFLLKMKNVYLVNITSLREINFWCGQNNS